jgi:hypothetical protein
MGRVRIIEGEAEGLTGEVLESPNSRHEGSDGQERITIITDDGQMLSVPESQIREGEKTTFGFGKTS